MIEEILGSILFTMILIFLMIAMGFAIISAIILGVKTIKHIIKCE